MRRFIVPTFCALAILIGSTAMADKLPSPRPGTQPASRPVEGKKRVSFLGGGVIVSSLLAGCGLYIARRRRP